MADKDYSGSYEENKLLHGKAKADEIGSSRIGMYLRLAPKSMKEHEHPYWQGDTK